MHEAVDSIRRYGWWVGRRWSEGILAWALVVGHPGPANAEVIASQYGAFDEIANLDALVDNARPVPIWRPDGKGFVYLADRGTVKKFISVDVATGKRHEFMDETRLRTALRRLGVDGGSNLFESFAFVRDGRAIRFHFEGRTFELELGAYQLRELASEQRAELEASQPQAYADYFPGTPRAAYELPSPDGQRFLAVKGNNLWIRDRRTGATSQLTSDGVVRFGWHGESFPWPFAASAWSPDGATIASFKADTRSGKYLPVIDWARHPEAVTYQMFANAGGPLPKQTLVLIDVRSGAERPITTGEDSGYIRTVGWDRAGEVFSYLWLARSGRRVELRAVDRTTGRVDVRWSEEDTKFVVAPLRFVDWDPSARFARDADGLAPQEAATWQFDPQVEVLSDGRFVLSSQRSGLWQLYLYGPDTYGNIKLVRQLTQGSYPIVSLVKVDEARGYAYFLAHPDRDRVYDSHLMRVQLDGRGLRQLTSGAGEHAIRFSPRGDYFLDTYSTVEHPPVTELRKVDGALVATVETADATRLKRLGWIAPEEFSVKAADGTTNLYGIIQKPPNFDAAKKYPLVEYIYAGPQTTVVPRTFIPADRLTKLGQALTQVGFIVVEVDGPGTPERGKAFEDAVYGQLGQAEIPNHAAAIKNLALERPYIDLNRVGVFGLSYGGYFAARALLQAPQFYKVGVAASVMADLDNANAIAVESYMGGGPEDAPKAYEYADNMKLAGHMQGHLLVIQGTSDINTPLFHALKLTDALRSAGKDVEFAALPGAKHDFEYEDHRLPDPPQFEALVRNYLLKELKP